MSDPEGGQDWIGSMHICISCIQCQRVEATWKGNQPQLEEQTLTCSQFNEIKRRAKPSGE